MSVSGNPSKASTLSAQLQTTLSGRTLSGIVRSELTTIEAALRLGLRYEQLCQHLEVLGVNVSPGTLRQTVYRLRKKQRLGDTSSRPPLHPAPDALPLPDSASGTSTSPPPAFKAPVETGPRPERLALSDQVPLLEVKPAQQADFAPPTDFITAIRQSTPDLDVLAYRYRQSQQARRSPVQTDSSPSTEPAQTADFNPSSSSPGSNAS